jgi:hypothetical protein
MLLAVCAVGVLAFVVIPRRGTSSPALRSTLSSRLIVGLLVLGGAAWWAHSWVFGRFVSAEVSASGVVLEYAGLGGSARQVELQRGEIRSVLVGSAGKYNTQCSISFEIEGDVTYRSVWLDRRLPACREMRDQVVRMLGLKQ